MFKFLEKTIVSVNDRGYMDIRGEKILVYGSTLSIDNVSLTPCRDTIICWLPCNKSGWDWSVIWKISQGGQTDKCSH